MAKRRWLLLAVGLALAGSGWAQGQKALGELFSGDASVRGSVLLRAQATEVLSGSQIAAGAGSAVLKLTRGGQLRICPRTGLSLDSDPSGKALSLGLNAGAMELDYSLDSGADSLITPDFRLQLISPGSFHLAISVNSAGDTCLHSLPGDSAAVFVTEMMGNGVYQLSPGKSVLFRGGKIPGASEAPANCGCPEIAPLARPATETAHAQAPAPVVARPPAAAVTEPQQSAKAADSAELPPPVSTRPSQAEPLRSEQPKPVKQPAQPQVAHLEADTRFSYRGDQAVQDFYGEAARLSLSTDNSRLALALLPQVSGPAQASRPPAATRARPARRSGGFFGFLRRLFGG
jgi:hypothetical protein